MAKGGKKSPVQGVLRTVLLVFISLVLGILAYSWNAKRLVGNEMPMPFGYGLSVVLSGSMEPELSVDDLVLVKVCDSYQEGDIIVYQSGDILVIHRILAIDGESVIPKGDANDIADEPIPLSAVKGRLIGVMPQLGALVRMIKSPTGIILMLAAAALLFELSWRREKQLDSEELDMLKQEIQRLKVEMDLKESEAAENEGKTQ